VCVYVCALFVPGIPFLGRVWRQCIRCNITFVNSVQFAAHNKRLHKNIIAIDLNVHSVSMCDVNKTYMKDY